MNWPVFAGIAIWAAVCFVIGWIVYCMGYSQGVYDANNIGGKNAKT